MGKIIIPNTTTLSYPVSCDSYANVSNALEIWIKFTSYFSKEEIEYINELNQLPIYLILADKIQKYLKIREKMELSKLLIKYKNRKCTQEEHDKVVDYMQNTSLRNLVNSRVSEEEKEKVSLFLNDFETIGDLKKYIESKDNDYTELSIHDAYILFYAKEKLYNIEQSELNDKIRNEKIEKASSLKKSLIRDYGHNF